MVNLDCHLNWIYSPLEDMPLGMSMKAFSERFNSGGKTNPEYGLHHYIGWDPGRNEKGDSQLGTSDHVSKVTRLPFISAFITIRDCTLKLYARAKLSFLEFVCQVFCYRQLEK